MRSIDDLLHKVFDSYLSSDALKNLEVLKTWNGIVGAYAEHCEPIDLKNGSLVIAIDHPGWHTKFKFKEQQFLKAVQKEHPHLKIKKFVYVFDKDKYAEFTRANREQSTQKQEAEPINEPEKDQNPPPLPKNDGKPEFLNIVENIKRHLK